MALKQRGGGETREELFETAAQRAERMRELVGFAPYGE